MPLDVGRIRVERVIIHDVPRGQTPVLSDFESETNQEIRNFIQERLRESIHSGGLAVRLESDHEGDAPECLLEYFTDPAALFVVASQRLAQALSSAESHVHASEGLLAVVGTRYMDQVGIAVVKLQREKALHLRDDERPDGLRAITVEMLSDLVFTADTEVYKVGHFIQNGETKESIYGDVADMQAIKASKKGSAEYWIGDFLGCRYYDDPPVQTKNVFGALIDFVQTEVQDTDSKMDYIIGGQATMRSNQESFRPIDIAEQYFHGEDRQRFVDFLREKGIDPAKVVQKDTTLISNDIKQLTLKLSTSIEVSGSPEAMDNHVHKVPGPDGQVQIIIDGAVQTVRPK